MENPRQGRVAERRFLNLPGFHAGAYVFAYIGEHHLPAPEGQIPHPRLELELADCVRRIQLVFDLSSPEQRMNSFHKIDTLIEVLRIFREGMAAEATLYRRRVRGRGTDSGPTGRPVPLRYGNAHP